MSIEEKLRNAAKRVAHDYQSRAAALYDEYLELQERAAQKKAESDAARGAPERLFSFEPRFGGKLQCPRCWIENKVRSEVYGVAGAGTEDILRCERKGHEFSFPARG